ncbi:calcium-binding protein [Tychonema sp. BBK16]|uniref:beta strand repeat-containing protein n=1 Tax=Tychonema sp. BBK16 TaxID=2699888 RepID=UPI00272A134F|nr:calcium-binding protein [Tychonema sp. BBK16]
MKELILADDSKFASQFNGRPEEGGIVDSGDSIVGTDNDDSIATTTANKRIFGKKGKDKIKGSKGKDKIYGGKGDDICDGDEDDDEVRGDQGKDKVYGGKGNDTVYGGKDEDEVSGGKGKDNVSGDEGNDTCMGDEGDDTVSGGAGKDTVIGGKGNDTCMGDEGDDSIVGGEGDDSAIGGEGKDTVIGGAGKDTCIGGDGDDSVVGGADDDTLIGGAGNDVCMGDDGDDSIAGSGGDDTVMGGAGKDTVIAGDGKDMVDGGDGDDSVVGGGDGDDTLMGSEGNDTIVGGTGNHTCVGGAGDDVFVISDRNSGPNSVITDFTVNDKFLISGSLNFSSFSFVQVGVNTEIRGSSNFVLAVLLNINASILRAGNFLGIDVPANFNQVTTPTPIRVLPIVLPPTPVTTPTPVTNTIDKTVSTQPELIVGNSSLPNDLKGGSGDDNITGGKNKDKIIGGAGKDNIKADDGDDDIDGGDDDDDIEGGKGSDTIKGGKGKDKGKGGDGDDNIDGGDDDDEIEGGIGNDKVIGGAGNDTLTGNEGDDEIEGGEGKNTLSGGAGKNKFIYNKSREGSLKVEDADLITDFKVDEDILDFSNAAFALSVASLTRIEINASSTTGSIGSGNLLDFSADVSVRSIATLQARFQALGGDSERPTFCQFTDEATGRTVLVFAVGIRFEVVASFSVKFSLKVSNFVFTGPPLTLPVGTSGPDNVNFGTSPVGIKFDGLAGNDNIIGSNFGDRINGGDGDDTITGGGGVDVLNGGSGADIFAYTTTKEGGDKISDFKSGTDKFQFVTSAFGNLTTTNFDGVSGSAPDITGKELVIFTGGTYATIEAAQAKATGSSTTPGFFVFTNAANESVLVFDSNGTLPGGSSTIANLGTAASNLGTADFVFTGAFGSVTPPQPPANNSIVDLNAPNNTYPIAINNFGSGAGGYNFSTPVLFTGNGSANTVIGTPFADRIEGGGGADILTGGSGADLFIYKNPGEGDDKITDFASGVDKLQFVSGAFGNLTTTNFDGVSGSAPDITGKELVIFTSGTYASVQDAQLKATGSSTTPGFFAFKNAANETVLVFDSNGTTTGGSTTVANFGTAAVSLGTSDFVFTGALGSSPAGTSPAGTTPSASSIVDLIASPGTFPTSGVNNFGSGVGGYNFSTPVLFTGNGSANTVIGTPFADRIEGGGGADILTGGSGADLFIYKNPGEGDDKITDFASGVDKLQFVSGAFGNLTTTNFDGVSSSTPDITGKELVIFTGGTYATIEAAQAKATGSSTTPGFFVFTNPANETVLVFDSNGTLPGGSTTVANFGTAAVSLGTSDFVFTGALGSVTPPPAASSTVNLITNPGTFPASGINNFGSGVGGYNFTTPVLFTGNSTANNVTGTDFADIMNGGSGADIFDGGAGNDSLFGGPGSDTLNGGVGNDTLIGGLGTNVLNGGAGLDVFVFTGTSTGGGDLITNYSIADDVINLDKTGFTAFATGAGQLGSSFYKYSSTVSVSVTTVELSLTGPSIMAIYDGLSTKLYYDSNGSTPGGSNLFATVNVDLGVSGNSELFLF